MITAYRDGTTYRTACRRGRAVYDKKWDRTEESKPWQCFRDGTATLSFNNLAECSGYFASLGMSLDLSKGG